MARKKAQRRNVSRLRPRPENSDTRDLGLNNRKVISFNYKLDKQWLILNRLDGTLREALNHVEPSRTTVAAKSVKEQKDKIDLQQNMVSLRPTSTSFAKVNRVRSKTMKKMERLLSLWIADRNKKNIPPSLNSIQEKALSLYKYVKNEEGELWKKEVFTASKEWLEKFHKRQNLYWPNRKASRETVGLSSDVHSALDSSDELKMVIKEGGYSPQQVFNVAETVLFWKIMPERIYMAQDEMVAPVETQFKDRITILLGGNATGDLKLKPLLAHTSLNPSMMQSFKSEQLPVTWRKNKNSCFNSTIFTDWFSNYFCPAVTSYCERSNISYKALLIIDSASWLPPDISTLSSHVKIVIWPKNKTSIIQPMNQGIIALFKAYYLRQTFCQLLRETDSEDKPTVNEWWSNFNIYKAVLNIGESWTEVKKTAMNGVWKEIWPECVENIQGFEDVSKDALEVLSEIRLNILNIVHDGGFKEINDSDLLDILKAPSEALTNDKLLELGESCEVEEGEIRENIALPSPSDRLNIKCLEKAMTLINVAMDIFIENDPDIERSQKVSRGVYQQINCYKEIYNSLKAREQHSVHDYFQSREASNSLPVKFALNAEPAMQVSSQHMPVSTSLFSPQIMTPVTIAKGQHNIQDCFQSGEATNSIPVNFIQNSEPAKQTLSSQLIPVSISLYSSQSVTSVTNAKEQQSIHDCFQSGEASNPLSVNYVQNSEPAILTLSSQLMPVSSSLFSSQSITPVTNAKEQYTRPIFECCQSGEASNFHPVNSVQNSGPAMQTVSSQCMPVINANVPQIDGSQITKRIDDVKKATKIFTNDNLMTLLPIMKSDLFAIQDPSIEGEETKFEKATFENEIKEEEMDFEEEVCLSKEKISSQGSKEITETCNCCVANKEELAENSNRSCLQCYSIGRMPLTITPINETFIINEDVRIGNHLQSTCKAGEPNLAKKLMPPHTSVIPSRINTAQETSSQKLATLVSSSKGATSKKDSSEHQIFVPPHKASESLDGELSTTLTCLAGAVEPSNIPYKLVENATMRGGMRLIDSEGYSYTRKRSNSKSTTWLCQTRNKKVYCNASVMQSSDNMFHKGPSEHCHPAPLFAWQTAKVTSAVRTQIMLNPSESAIKIAKEAIYEHLGSDAPAKGILNPINVAKNANYWKRRLLTDLHPPVI